MDVALWRGRHGVLVGVSKIRNWSRSSHENQLPEIFEVLDSLLEDIWNAFYGRLTRPAFEPSEWIWNKQFGPSRQSNGPSCLKSFPVQRIPAQQDRGSQSGTKHYSCTLDRFGGSQRRLLQCWELFLDSTVSP